ncbi:MAG: hypothetical protein EON88_03370 [Brevundimonas sp.]|nr:MAG: hypothetical protein EON88_03370 [Brevundimonas sp.]
MLKIALAAASIVFLTAGGPAPATGGAPQTAYVQTRLSGPGDGGGGNWDPTSPYEMCLRNFGCEKYPDGSIGCSQDWYFRVCADAA